MTDQDTLELRRIVADDPLPVGPPDVDGLVTAGARRLRRRRIGVGAAAVAALAAVSVPTYVVAEGDSPGPSVSDPAAPPPMATPGPGAKECGALLCIEPEQQTGRRASGLAGQSWVLTQYSDGSEEVVYAVRATGRTNATDRQSEGAVLGVGRRTDAGIGPRLTALTLHTGFDLESPDGDPVRFWSNQQKLGAGGHTDEYMVLGFVPGTPEEITWSTPDGASGPVDGTSTTVVDGFTVFYLTPKLPEGYESTGDTPRRDIGGDGVILEGDPTGATWPPELTIHTSDGWSCSLADCGSMG